MTRKPKPFVGWAIMCPDGALEAYLYRKRSMVTQIHDWKACYDSGYRVIKVKITPLTGGKR